MVQNGFDLLVLDVVAYAEDEVVDQEIDWLDEVLLDMETCERISNDDVLEWSEDGSDLFVKHPFYHINAAAPCTDGFIHEKLNYEYTLDEFLGEDLAKLKAEFDKQLNENWHFDMVLVYAWSTDCTKDEEGFKDCTDEWHLQGVIDLSSVPFSNGSAVYELKAKNA